MCERYRRGFALLELLPAAALVLLAAIAAVTWVTRSTQHADWTRDKVFARQKAVSILGELRAYVEGGDGEVAADLDGFDDGLDANPALTIAPDPDELGAYLPPDHPVSGNLQDRDVWRWWRRITVRPFPGVNTRDLRICTVRMFRLRPEELGPGEKMAEVSTVVRTVGDAYPTTQVYDVYLLALENSPGWWVYMDAIQPFVEATFSDLEARNPGLVFRTHWITKSGYGRDEEYAPYTNETRDSCADTPWTYVYPGRMPDGESAQRYYVPERMGARINVDGTTTPAFANGPDAGNPHPYALADMHNHCMRWPDADALFRSRVEDGIEDDGAPTWRLLLDRMVSDPERYHNAILINLHGELLPMPPVRNVSDPAKDPVACPGWRAVTHPERLRPRRVAGNDSLTDAPRFRVYAYKSAFHDTELLTTQAEPFLDADGDAEHDDGETYLDWNGNGVRDAGRPISLVIRDADLTWAPNDASAPSLRVRCLAGGVDGDGDGNAEPYCAWADAHLLPEPFGDANADGIRQVAEAWLDLDGDGVHDVGEPWQEVDGDGAFTAGTETLQDGDGDNVQDGVLPAEPFADSNSNGRWDAAEPYADLDGDGARTPATAPITPWQPWDPADLGDASATASYVLRYGEPFLDVDLDGVWDDAETLFDANGNGVRDGGIDRGAMCYEIRHETGRGTVLLLHGTPLETPYRNDAANVRKGLPTNRRLYDMDYVPCPTPSSATGTDRFACDLFTSSDTAAKNTARWILEIPPSALRRGFASATGANDGDASNRVIAVETRIGSDLDTGVTWPVAHEPPNVSTTYAYLYADAADLPFSERAQFQGDPRHCPYADLDRTGTTSPHGYNWYFDDFRDASGDQQSAWAAFDGTRLQDRWRGRAALDVPRYLAWLRTALARTETVYTTLTGFSYYYLSVGGDVGYDSANGFPDSIPLDGTPFGLTGDVHENTITTGEGTTSIRGSRKYVRSSTGMTLGIRADGYWWSKPWLGEIWPDDAYETQWRAFGNLRAGNLAQAGVYRLTRRGDVSAAQQPTGTTLLHAYARLKEEGCTSLFGIGTSASTFHHQYKNGQTGSLVEDGPQLAENYNFPLPTTALISRPFGLHTSGSGGVGDEFGFPDTYPRFSAEIVRRFYDHAAGQTGSAVIRLEEPAGERAGFIVVNGIDRTLESGSAFISRYAALSLIHSFFAAGAPGQDHRIRQLPRVEVRHPTLITELEDPGSIQVRWSVEWKRWDGLPYTDAYPATHTEDESDLLYVPMYSADGGKTWRDMLRGEPVEPGTMPWREGVGPDPDRTLTDQTAGSDESFTWLTPSAGFPEGSYMVRVEVYRSSETLHYSHHQEKIYVNR